MQRLVASAAWDVEGVRDDLRAYVRESLGDRANGPHGVLIVDETGFLKKGTKSAGVQRQYSGTAGRIENCQLVVFLAYATARGHAFVDRELYVPASWMADRARCREAKIPRTVRFRTKPQLAQTMLQRALAGGLRPRWVLGDEVYGNHRALRQWLEQQRQPYVLAVRCTSAVRLADPDTPGLHRVATLADALPRAAWQRHSAGAGSKGPRWYDWALLPVAREEEEAQTPGHRALLIRRHPTSGERAYYLVFSLRPIRRDAVVSAAGQRWAIEQGFEESKQEVGLDEYEVRTYGAWYRFMTLTLYAHAFLAAMRARQRPRKRGPRQAPGSSP